MILREQWSRFGGKGQTMRDSAEQVHLDAMKVMGEWLLGTGEPRVCMEGGGKNLQQGLGGSRMYRGVVPCDGPMADSCLLFHNG